MSDLAVEVARVFQVVWTAHDEVDRRSRKEPETVTRRQRQIANDAMCDLGAAVLTAPCSTLLGATIKLRGIAAFLHCSDEYDNPRERDTMARALFNVLDVLERETGIAPDDFGGAFWRIHDRSCAEPPAA